MVKESLVNSVTVVGSNSMHDLHFLSVLLLLKDHEICHGFLVFPCLMMLAMHVIIKSLMIIQIQYIYVQFS